MLPIIIEDLINKVKDSRVHPEKRQHYVVTLQKIINASEDAIKAYERDKFMKVK